MTIHVVQAGETVGSIAESYGVDPARLAADNAVPPSGALAVGQTLDGPLSPARSTLSGPGRPWLPSRRHTAPQSAASGKTTGLWAAEQPSSRTGPGDLLL